MALLLPVPSPFVWLMLLGVSIADVVVAVRRSETAVFSPARAWAKLLSLSVVPRAAWVSASLTSGWSDVDGNGMLDWMVAGAYDSSDIVLPHALVWGRRMAGGDPCCGGRHRVLEASSVAPNLGSGD